MFKEITCASGPVLCNRINLILGRNGVGKTNFLKALRTAVNNGLVFKRDDTIQNGKTVYLNLTDLDEHTLNDLSTDISFEKLEVFLKLEPRILGVSTSSAQILAKTENGVVPLSSFGGGVTRQVALALGVAATKNGVLLIDNIDADSHHSVMAGMWTRVIEAARRENIQVFATTHSSDCIRALSEFCQGDERKGVDVRVHHFTSTQVITYPADELIIAIKGCIELRG
jgi:AAA15 family ATPase/GTPase